MCSIFSTYLPIFLCYLIQQNLENPIQLTLLMMYLLLTLLFSYIVIQFNI